MLRSYRGILIAIVGWLSLTAARPETENSQQNATINVAEPPPPYAPYPDLTENSCYHAKNHEAADLCAQWRAAIAAEKAARATQVATSWSKAATALSALALVSLIWTLLQTESALGEARRGNRIARKAARRQLRPYVSFIETPPRNRPFTSEDTLTMVAKNFGQTPANEVHLCHASELRHLPIGWDEVELRPESETLGRIAPGDHRTAGFNFSELTTEDISDIVSGKTALLMRCRLSYQVRREEFDSDDVTIMIDDSAWRDGDARIVSEEDRKRAPKSA